MGLMETRKQVKAVPLPKTIMYLCKKILMNEESLQIINRYTIQNSNYHIISNEDHIL